MALKLNVGCGDRSLDGYIGVDIREVPGVTTVCPMWEVHLHHQNVDEVYCRHALEHLTFHDAARAIESFSLALRPGGALVLVVPDLAFHCSQILGKIGKGADAPAPVKRGGTQLHHGLAGLYGWQRQTDVGETWDVHKSGYTERTLADLLRRHQFVDVRRVKREPWHLDMRAVRAPVKS